MEKGIWKERPCSHEVTCYEGVLSTPGKGSNRECRRQWLGMRREMGRASLAGNLSGASCVGKRSLEPNGKSRRPGGRRESQEVVRQLLELARNAGSV